jgi:hypothetical protein
MADFFFFSAKVARIEQKKKKKNPILPTTHWMLQIPSHPRA